MAPSSISITLLNYPHTRPLAFPLAGGMLPGTPLVALLAWHPLATHPRELLSRCGTGRRPAAWRARRSVMHRGPGPGRIEN